MDDGFCFVEEKKVVCTVPKKKTDGPKPNSDSPPKTNYNKKPRANRGFQVKARQGDIARFKNKITTDITPCDYLNVVEKTDLDEEHKLPARVVHGWKEALDNANFSERMTNDPEANTGMTYLKSEFMKYVKTYQSCPVRDSSDSGESTVMVPDASTVDITMKMTGMTLKYIPHHIRNFQGKGGQSSDTVQ